MQIVEIYNVVLQSAVIMLISVLGWVDVYTDSARTAQISPLTLFGRDDNFYIFVVYSENPP